MSDLESMSRNVQALDLENNYTPTFTAQTRKIIYVFGTVVSVLAGCSAVIAVALHAPEYVTVISTVLNMAGGTLCGAFGVKYVGQAQ